MKYSNKVREQKDIQVWPINCEAAAARPSP